MPLVIEAIVPFHTKIKQKRSKKKQGHESHDATKLNNFPHTDMKIAENGG